MRSQSGSPSDRTVVSTRINEGAARMISVKRRANSVSPIGCLRTIGLPDIVAYSIGLDRHSRESGNPGQPTCRLPWTPAFAGVTGNVSTLPDQALGGRGPPDFCNPNPVSGHGSLYVPTAGGLNTSRAARPGGGSC